MTAVICDLDGVVYTGSEPVPRSADALEKLYESGIATYFATNNSTRTPEDAAAKITRITGVKVSPEQVITSALAAASLADGPGPALVVGGEGIVSALLAVGVDVTEDPTEASMVVVGMDQHLTYDKVARANAAIRRGARFIASNDDPTYPSPDGLLPGAGAMVAAIATASGVKPVVAGKPHAPMRALLRQRVGDGAWVIGDRIETDIAMASEEDGWRSIVVLSGVSTREEAEGAADFVARDLFEAVEIVVSAPLTR